MDLVCTSSEEPGARKRRVNAAPATDMSAAAGVLACVSAPAAGPVAGPANPRQTSALAKTVLTGAAEELVLSHAAFDRNQRHFVVTGTEYCGQDVQVSKADAQRLKRKRQAAGDVTCVSGANAYRGPWAKYEVGRGSTLSDAESDAGLAEEASQSGSDAGADGGGDGAVLQVQTLFHGESGHDYLGRSYMHVPQDLDIRLDKEPLSWEVFLPKRKIREWVGHEKGVSSLEFFPRAGHLLLSAGQDGKVMLWDCFHDRRLLRTNIGHSNAVRAARFSGDGASIASCGSDKRVQLWDTETGRVIHTFMLSGAPYGLAFNPNDSREFLVGTGTKEILQYDVRSGEIVQQYNHHLSAVYTLTFYDDGRRFISTSEDKSLRVWEYGNPTPVKYVAEPHMHSLTSVDVDPLGKYAIAQSMDDHIAVFSTEKFRQNRRRAFRGHSCNGYRIQTQFSPDARWVASGDTGGYLCFWDWKSTKLVKKIKAHEGPAVCIAWHPQETSKVASAGVDAVIRYWD